MEKLFTIRLFSGTEREGFPFGPRMRHHRSQLAPPFDNTEEILSQIIEREGFSCWNQEMTLLI